MTSRTLYHGTTLRSAERMLSEGWSPHSHPSGSQCGRPHLLCLTTTPDNALWYAQEKGCTTVLEITVPLTHLGVDPDDGVADTVTEECQLPHGLPGNLVCKRPLPSTAFRLHATV